jgi:phosphoenolpyruvate---glycerone phosphotransferase subunit DhaL
MALNADDLAAWLRVYAGTVEENRDELVALDAAIGDADHGENMVRGMRAVVQQLDEKSPSTPADVLKLAATTLISKVGGAAGPLYGTAFLRAGGATKDKDSLEVADLVDLLTAARDGIVARGKAEPGDKTMVDAWTPAVTAAAEAAAGSGADVKSVLEAAAGAAEQGALDTTPLVARKGRASYLGERSAGHQDPGATSSALLLRCLADVAS